MTSKTIRGNYPIPATAERLLVALRESDKDTGGEPRLPDGQEAFAREWLMEVLLDTLLRFGHTDVLARLYSARFRRPRIRHDWPDWDVRPEGPAPDPLFPHNDLMAAVTDAVARGGVGADVLPADQLAVLLLNPYALWDLADVIDFRLPEWWDGPMCKRGERLMAESGFVLPMPTPRLRPGPAPELAGHALQLPALKKPREMAAKDTSTPPSPVSRKYREPSPGNRTATLTWPVRVEREDDELIVTLYGPDRNRAKNLGQQVRLAGVTGKVENGRVVYLAGQFGAGDTTLTLTLEVGPQDGPLTAWLPVPEGES